MPISVGAVEGNVCRANCAARCGSYSLTMQFRAIALYLTVLRVDGCKTAEDGEVRRPVYSLPTPVFSFRFPEVYQP